MNGLRVGLLILVAIAVAFGTAPAARADRFYDQEDLSLFLDAAAADAMVADGAPGEAAPEGEPAAPPAKGPPLPLHSLEGVSGGAITPMAYFANAGPPGTKVAMPSMSYTYLVAGSKVVNSIAYSQVFYNRIEFSYAWNRVGLGDFPGDVRGLGVHLGRTHVHMHNFNLRGIIVPEGTGGEWMPMIVAGVHFKHNPSVQNMDSRLGGAANNVLGFERNNGVDYTVTFGKMFAKGFLDRPVLVNAGLRFTEAAQTGWLGFGDTYRTNVEANIAWVPFDWLAIGYEYKEKQNPYRRLPGARNLVGVEDAWHTILLAWIVNEHCTLAGVWGHLGNIVNGEENGGWGVQFKYEF